MQEAAPDHAAALRQEFSTYSRSDAAAANARRRQRQQTFGSEHLQRQRGRTDPTAPHEHAARLRREFGQDRTARNEEAQGARRERLHDTFAKGRAGERKSAEQLRQALQEQHKPTHQRDAGKPRDGSPGKGGGRDIEQERSEEESAVG